ncbi:MAG: SRPBCC domain-containing protein [Ramlibacter sp.]|nr:SRPBCC domain-containing protein [Ramlibacter sp.]
MISAGPCHKWQLWIRAQPSAVWSILTDDAQTARWQHLNMPSRTDWRAGGDIRFFMGDRAVITGKLIELRPPRHLSHTFSAQWSPEVAADPASRVAWELEPIGQDACRLTLTHSDFGGDTATARAVADGWPEALSRLKTLAETGQPFLLPEAVLPAN